MADYSSELVDISDYFESDGVRSYDRGSTEKIPSGGTVTTFNMRAYNTVLTRPVYWIASGSPDFTGASSGYPVIDLTDIVVLTWRK